MRPGEGTPLPKGSVLAILIRAQRRGVSRDQWWAAIFLIDGYFAHGEVRTQAEIDQLWEQLSEGRQKIECGWLTDKFGLSWQIVPAKLGEPMSSGNAAKTPALISEVMKMRKLDLATLQRAYDMA